MTFIETLRDTMGNWHAPLGVEAAIRARIEYIVTLTNTPLDISSDFKGTISFDDKEKNKIFKDTKSASSFLKEWCCNRNNKY